MKTTTIKSIIVLLTIVFPFLSQAQTATWSGDIAEIVYNNCTSCHRTGNIAPSVYESYADVQADAFSIQAQVNAGSMPPWPPDPNYSRHAHERILTPTQIAKINDWVNNGTPVGDLALAPPVPNFNDGTSLSSVDLSVKMPDYSSVAAMSDEYRCFVVPSGISTDKFIQELEIIPGNRDIVHHVLVFTDNSGGGASLDAADPAPGYTCFGDAGVSGAQLVGVWAPGGDAMKLPNGFGVKMPANSDIILQLHYPVGSVGSFDSSRVNMKFTTGTAREVYAQFVLNHSSNISEPLIIPANTVKSFYEEFSTIPINITLFAVAPHMHLIGTDIKTYMVGPTGDTTKLNHIKDWDFHWQGLYFFPNPVKVTSGSKLRAEATYDNTTANPNNPNSPPATIVLGEATTNEMMLVLMFFSIYMPGDENIVIDSSIPDLTTGIQETKSITGFNTYPNPSNDLVKWDINPKDIKSVSMFDHNGKLCWQQNESNGQIDIKNFSAGTYVLKIETEKQTYMAKFVKQ